MSSRPNFEVIIKHRTGAVESIYTHENEWQADLECEVARERGMFAVKRDLRPTDIRTTRRSDQ